MILVLDASPIITLSKIDQLTLVPRLAEDVWFPTAGYEEVFAHDPKKAAVLRVDPPPWLRQRAVHDHDMVQHLRKRLGKGEAEAIALAKETPGSVVVLDDALGRKTAHEQNVPVVGVVGLFVYAKKIRMLAAIEPLLLHIREAGFYLDNRLLDAILKEVGERK